MRTNPNEERQQIALIARATFGGFLQSDLMPAGQQASARDLGRRVPRGASAVPVRAGSRQVQLPASLPSAAGGDGVLERQALFLLLSCGAIGIVAVVMWDTLFPSAQGRLRPRTVARLDARALGGATRRPPHALRAVCGGPERAAGTSVSARVRRELHRDSPRPGRTRDDVAGGGPFVFFGLTTLQGVLIVATSRRAAERLAPMIQTGAVLLLLLGLLFFGPLRQATTAALARGNDADAFLRWCPLAWFVGLYGTISGSPRPIMHSLAVRGLLAGALPFLATVALYVLGVSPVVRPGDRISGALDLLGLATLVAAVGDGLRQESGGTGHLRVRAAGADAQPAPPDAAVDLRRRSLCAHRRGLLPEILNGHADRFAASRRVLAAPFILSAALAVGFRTLLAIPVDLPARWVFRTSPVSPFRVAGGTHKASLIIVLLPVAVVAWSSAIVLWGPAIAWRHTLFSASLSLLLIELLLVTYRGVPFACVYVPGGSRLHVLWPLYLSSFIAYTYSAATTERELLAHGGLVPVVVTLLVISAGLAAFRLWRAARDADISFAVEIPDETFAGFNLSEGLAAQAVARRPTV